MSDFNNDDFSSAFYADTSVLYSSVQNPLADDKPAKNPSTPIVQRPVSDQVIAYWGDDNNYPRTIYEKGLESPVISATIQDKADIAAAGKVYYGKRVLVKGQEHFERALIPEIEDFIINNNLQTGFLTRAYTDLYWYYNVFPELILNPSNSQVYFSDTGKTTTAPKSKILAVNIQDAQNCRWSLQNKKGRIHTCYINAQWHENASPTSKETLKVPVIDNFFDPTSWLRNVVSGSKKRKFIYPLSYYTSGKTFYQLPTWTSVLHGWLDVALSIPKFKKAIMENAITIKYHIKVAHWYWEQKYPDWKEKETLQAQRRKDELDNFNNILAGAKNAGRSIMTEFQSHHGKETHGWHIEAIDGSSKFADGIYLDDGEAANLQLLYALNFPAALSGNALSKSGGNSAGGSEVQKRFNTYLTKCASHQRLILEILNFISRYNGWKDGGMPIEFRQEKPFIQDLTNITPAKREPMFDDNKPNND